MLDGCFNQALEKKRSISGFLQPFSVSGCILTRLLHNLAAPQGVHIGLKYIHKWLLSTYRMGTTVLPEVEVDAEEDDVCVDEIWRAEDWVTFVLCSTTDFNYAI